VTVSNDPIFATGFSNFAARATAAKTTMTDNTNAVLAHTAGAEGSWIKRLRVRAEATFAANLVAYAFTSSDGGTTLRMKSAVLLTAATVSDTVAPIEYDLGPTETTPWRLSASERLYVAVSKATPCQFDGDFDDFAA
jgi:hypothetical protein